ncbi:MAG: cardiolipin synthase [bacterium]|nr:cardiolipin synthase [Candidatus Colousia faecequi]
MLDIFLNILYYTFTLLFVILDIAVIVVIVLENRNPVKTLAWIFMLLVFPFFGALVYLLIGRNHRSKKILKRWADVHVQGKKVSDEELAEKGVPEHFRKIFRLLDNEMSDRLYAGNNVEVYTSGDEIFDSLFRDIEAAKKHINIEFYIIEEGAVGNHLHDILVRKAQEGIEVRLLYDYVGGFRLPIEWKNSLKKAGVKINSFLSAKSLLDLQYINNRNHRKLVIIDGKIAYTGGVNIADRYRLGNHLGLWRDTFIKVSGPAVEAMQQAFLVDWDFVDNEKIALDDYVEKTGEVADEIVQIVTSGPDNDWLNMLNGIVAAINRARDLVWIHTPYFIPPEPLMQAMESAALSGVDVRLMLSEKSDSIVVSTAGRSYIDQLLSAGVKVYFYRSNFLHSKAIVIDGYLSIIGTANMDVRSFEQNFELAAFVYGEKTGKTLMDKYALDMRTCRELNLNAWRHRTLWVHAKESLARLLSPIF